MMKKVQIQQKLMNKELKDGFLERGRKNLENREQSLTSTELWLGVKGEEICVKLKNRTVTYRDKTYSISDERQMKEFFDRLKSDGILEEFLKRVFENSMLNEIFVPIFIQVNIEKKKRDWISELLRQMDQNIAQTIKNTVDETTKEKDKNEEKNYKG